MGVPDTEGGPEAGDGVAGMFRDEVALCPLFDVFRAACPLITA
jgi:hypothetical protein